MLFAQRLGTVLVAVFMVLAAAPRIALADFVVVSATAPGFTPGRIVRLDEEIIIPEGATVTLLSLNCHLNILY